MVVDASRLTSTSLQGVISPLVTPLIDRDQLDEVGLEKLLEHVISGGVHGVFILGTTGEAPCLSYRLRRQLITQTCNIVAGRVPVLVGVSDTAFIESIHLACHAKKAGADAAVLAAPYYFPVGQTELIGYVERIVAEIPLPLLLYNMPELTKVWFEIDTLRNLTQLQQIVGVKDSSGDLQYFKQLLELQAIRPDWSVFVGSDRLLPTAVLNGGAGAVCGGANIYPQLFVSCYGAAMRRDQQACGEFQQRIEQLQAIYSIGRYASRHIKAIKCALSLLGICSDFMAEPFHCFHPAHRDAVHRVLNSLAAASAPTMRQPS